MEIEMKMLKGLLLVLFLALSACTPGMDKEKAGTVDSGETPPAVQLTVENAIRDLDVMRSTLAGTIETEEVDAGTFAQVCKPVGMQAQKIAQDNKWIVRQVAVKYRNPANKADAEAADIAVRLESEAGLDSLWLRTEREGSPGWRYLRRITVEPTCLACHGAKDERPEFVQAGYPEDRAFDFSTGDLRGLYSVFVPDM